MAKKRFQYIENRFRRDLDLLLQYSGLIQEYSSLGQARYVSLTMKNSNNVHKYFFVPHYCIIQNDKTSMLLRVVLDALMKTPSEYSLNDNCLKVLVVQPKLFVVSEHLSFRVR